MPRARLDTNKASCKLLSKVEHLAAKESEISFRRWWRTKTQLKREGLLDRNRTLGEC